MRSNVSNIFSDYAELKTGRNESDFVFACRSEIGPYVVGGNFLYDGGAQQCVRAPSMDCYLVGFLSEITVSRTIDWETGQTLWDMVTNTCVSSLPVDAKTINVQDLIVHVATYMML